MIFPEDSSTFVHPFSFILLFLPGCGVSQHFTVKHAVSMGYATLIHIIHISKAAAGEFSGRNMEIFPLDDSKMRRNQLWRLG